ncbi:receptor-type tyrosine-protein phosphatase H-like [Scomber japonicus]|uniref:receptor-type tyrosine-protein phosphatase H-like n=1 Tax=Scomber japonicus TaxID=13676 RepID=UPI002306479F|nr:receptor-type tyrosine-protein phosphatase H-like [Scomber japonicus]
MKIKLFFLAPPENVQNVTVLNQTESSITLRWNKVNDISTYSLKYVNNGIEKVESITATPEEPSVTHAVTGLSAGTKYDFFLLTTHNGVNSTGFPFSAATAPRNADDFKSIGQNETSITLQWNKVNDILNYILVFNGYEIKVTASQEDNVTYTVPGLTSGTIYDFSLFTVFENVRSSGVNLTAVTAPRNTDDFKSIGQSETSITLQWNKVNDILNYTLVLNGQEIKVTASQEDKVTYTVQGLTIPPAVDVVTVTARSETSVTLQWKNTDENWSYFLQINGEYITKPSGSLGDVSLTVSSLNPGTEYPYSVITVFSELNSTAFIGSTVTAPRNTDDFKSIGQNETSITLQWNKVNDILNYILVFNGHEINVTASVEDKVTYTVQGLTSGTKYDFSLFTVFENVRSSGVNLAAVAAPADVKARCENVAAGYSILIVFDKPKGLWTEVEVNVTGKTEKAISVAKFPDHFYHLSADENRGFSEEYEKLLPVGTEQIRKVALLPENKARNRFSNILPYDWCRVKLSTSNPTGASDYINASYMPGYKNNREYIAAQGPLPATVSDFWRMIWEQRVKGIVMVTNCTEGGRTKCEQYWPSDRETCLYGEMQVTNRSEQQESNWTLREFTLKYKNTSEERTVKHFHFTAWPDHGVPQGSEVLIQFRELFRQHIKTEGTGEPTVVHCSAGVGRTGTIIALDVLLQQLEREKAVGINAFVHKMTLNRPHMVQTEGATNSTTTSTPGTTTTATPQTTTLTTVPTTTKPPPENVQNVTVLNQTESSITLQWDKVNNISTYFLKYDNNGNDKEDFINETSEKPSVTHTVIDLSAGTKYDFLLLMTHNGVNSTGFNISAATAPHNAEDFKSIGQNETSITLQWNKVNEILNYTLVFNGSEIKVTPSVEDNVTYIVSRLTSGTKYDFSLFTVFENVRSSGVKLTAVAAPENVQNVTVLNQTESSITLQWDKVNNISTYFLKYDNNGNDEEDFINETSEKPSVTHTVIDLSAGTKYEFVLLTTHNGVNSTGFPFSAATAPRNAEDFKSIGQNETSITLQWNKVDDILNYIFAFNGSEINVTASQEDKVTYIVSRLTSGTKYDFSLFTVHISTCFHSAPADVKARCENVAAGYSILIVFDKPKGLWTEVEVNVTGKTAKYDNKTQKITIPGFIPAKSYEVSIALLSENVMSCTPYVFQCQTDPRGVIAGSVIAVLLFGVLVFLVVFILLKRPDIIRKKTFIEGSRQSKNSKAISIAKFPDHFYHLSADENRGFSEEYEKLLPVGTEQIRKVALLPENKARNRFSNVLPYDWCRVKLSTSNPTGASDYINASYMPGYKNNREYIATQGPLPATVNDFWRMIWEQRVKGIVMVTNCTEGRRTKCEQYWPLDRETCLYGEMQVTNRSEQQESNWTLREFTLKYKNTSEERTVKHFHFTAWPDHGVPQGTKVLIQFRELFRQHIKTEGTGEPTVVHCSAGVGRTGTIIALDVLLQQLEREKAVGINAFVHKMRLNRPHMVQTESQYVFLHQCIMDRLQPHEKPEENLYENVDMIYVNATALREFC